MGTTSRLQPRFHKGKASEYDRVVAVRTRLEHEKRMEQQGRWQVEKEAAERAEQERLRQLGITEEQLMTERSLAALHGAAADEDDETPALVFELGSSMMKAGFGAPLLNSNMHA
jgi:hypothetical protein